MGQFTIDLPENRKGEVRWGTVSKLQFSFFHKHKSQSKKAFIVQVSDSGGKTEYRLFQSKNGEWFKDAEGVAPLDCKILFDIKEAIVERETQGDTAEERL